MRRFIAGCAGVAVTVGCALAVTLLGCSSKQKTSGTAAPPQLTRDPLRLVTWNVQKCEGGLDNIVAELRRCDADIICLQEVMEPRSGGDAPDQTQELAARLGMHHFSRGGPFDVGRNQCVAVFCRAPLIATTALMSESDRNYGVTAVTVWGGSPLRIVCVHLTASYKLEWTHIQQTSAARERDWQALLEAAQGWTTGALVAGDFNTYPAASQFEALSALLPPTGDPVPTFPSPAPALPLDRIFLSPDLQAVSVVVGETEVSDHRPVVVELQRRSYPPVEP